MPTDPVMFIMYLPPELMAKLKEYAEARNQDVHQFAEEALTAAVTPQPLTEGL
jgi:predicted transcriptional regulator